MPQRTSTLFLAPLMLTVGLGATACGAQSPTGPSPLATLGAGNYVLGIYGTATCLSSTGATPDVSSATVRVMLTSTAAPDVWRVSVPAQTLTGEIALVQGQLQGWLRGSATADAVRLVTGDTPSGALGMESTDASNGRYRGPVLVGTPRYEGVGAASGASTTCAANAFTLQPA